MRKATRKRSGLPADGLPYGANAPAAVVNGFTGLEAVNVNNFGLTASPSTQGSFPANLNRDEAAVAAGSRPSDNLATSTIGNKTSLTAYDSGGAKVLYDFYYTKTGANTEVAVYRQDQSTNGGFPYTATPAANLVKESVTLAFDPATNKLTPTSQSRSPSTTRSAASRRQ